ncbi:MAG: YicC/YloC family endoribonuclease [Bdellovibrionota bacterium]
MSVREREQGLHSMTGYGRDSAAGTRFRVTVELRSVNGRFLELRPKVPRSLSFLEPKLREAVEKKLQRGVVDLTLTVQPLEGKVEAVVDEFLATAYANKVQKLAEHLKLDSGLTAAAILRLPGVVSGEQAVGVEADEELASLGLKALDGALKNLLAMRQSEGQKLATVLKRELDEIGEHTAAIQKQRDGVNERYFKKLQGKIEDLLKRIEGKVDDSRLYQEVAFYLDRSDLTEELDRLHSHLKQCEDALAGKTTKSVGKRLEFLSQEMGREVNTIGAKADQAELSNRVVEMKLTLEKVREQVQNLE